MTPVALDLFCCSGGVTKGLEAAGFDVIGVDLMRSQLPKDSPLYSTSDGTRFWTGDGECHMADLSTADAVADVIAAFKPDFVASSPPCQRFSTATPTKNRLDHPDLIASTREGILRSGVPGWIENVATDAVPLTGFWIMLCGTHFGLMKLKRHRRFELIGWRTQQPWHDDALCLYGSSDEDDLALGRRVAVAVAVAGHGAPDAEQSARYKRRAIESVHEGSNARAARERRLVSTISGDGGCSPGFGGDKGKRAAWRKRAVVSINDGENCPPGTDRTSPEGQAHIGKNRPGPECIRWREAMGWLDGPKDRYSLAQAIPPAYAEWLGRAFLEKRR